MSDPKPGCSPNLQVPQTLLLAGVSLCCRHIVVMIIVKIIIYEYLSFIIIIIHCYSLLWAEMLLQTQRSTSHPVSCQPRATRQDKDRDRDPSLPQLRLQNSGCCSQPRVPKSWEGPQRGRPVPSVPPVPQDSHGVEDTVPILG